MINRRRPTSKSAADRVRQKTKALRKQAGKRKQAGRRSSGRARTRARSAAPYVQRLIENEDLQLQLATAADRLRDVYGRLASQGTDAAEDKRMYASMRQAAGAIRKAGAELRQPPKRRRPRAAKILVVAVGVGVTAVAVRKVSSRLGGDSAPSYGSSSSASNGVWHDPANVPAPAAPAA